MSTILECKNLSKKYGRKTGTRQYYSFLRIRQNYRSSWAKWQWKDYFNQVNQRITCSNRRKTFYQWKYPWSRIEKIVSYLPERTYLDETQKVSEAITLFEDFYEDFDRSRAISMLEKLNIDSNARIKTLSKGTKEKYS